MPRPYIRSERIVTILEASPALADFHPLVRQWFEGRFGAPTDAQAAGWPHIRAGGETLICAPTGSGKTFAAFLASIDALIARAQTEALTDTTEVVYVSPLKALGNDIQRNLDGPLAEIAALAEATGAQPVTVRT